MVDGAPQLLTLLFLPLATTITRSDTFFTIAGTSMSGELLLSHNHHTSDISHLWHFVGFLTAIVVATVTFSKQPYYCMIVVAFLLLPSLCYMTLSMSIGCGCVDVSDLPKLYPKDVSKN